MLRVHSQVIFLQYLQRVLPILESGLPRLLVLLTLNAALTYMNYRGLHVVGEAAIAMTIFTLLPFFILCVLGAPHVHPANWFKVDLDAVQWLPFLNVMFWCLNYWDSVSTVAGEVANPGRTFPRALGAAMALVVASYLTPLLVGLGVEANGSEWTLGYFAGIAEHIGGKWLAWWLVVAAAVSQLGQFEAEMSTDSFQLQGMAERGFLPAMFARRSRHGEWMSPILFSTAAPGMDNHYLLVLRGGFLQRAIRFVLRRHDVMTSGSAYFWCCYPTCGMHMHFLPQILGHYLLVCLDMNG
jgi:amino acid transporter